MSRFVNRVGPTKLLIFQQYHPNKSDCSDLLSLLSRASYFMRPFHPEINFQRQLRLNSRSTNVPTEIIAFIGEALASRRTRNSQALRTPSEVIRAFRLKSPEEYHIQILSFRTERPRTLIVPHAVELPSTLMSRAVSPRNCLSYYASRTGCRPFRSVYLILLIACLRYYQIKPIACYIISVRRRKTRASGASMSHHLQ